MKIKFFVPIFNEDEKFLKNKNISLIDGQPLCSYLINTLCKEINSEDIFIFYEDELVKYSIQRTEPFNKPNFLKVDKEKLKYIKNISEEKSVSNFSWVNIFQELNLKMYREINPDWVIFIDPSYPLIKQNTINNLINIIKLNKTENIICAQNNLKNVLTYENNSKKLNYSNLRIVFDGLIAFRFSKLVEQDYKLNIFKNKISEYLLDISEGEMIKVKDIESFFYVESILRGLRLRDRNNEIKYFSPDIKGIERDLISLLSKDGSELDIKDLQFISGKVDIEKVIKLMGRDQSWSYPFVINGQDQVCLIQQQKGESCRRHHHITKSEFWVVLKGTFVWRIKNQTIYVKEGEIIRLLPGETHVITCVSEIPGIRLAMGASGMEHIYV